LTSSRPFSPSPRRTLVLVPEDSTCRSERFTVSPPWYREKSPNIIPRGSPSPPRFSWDSRRSGQRNDRGLLKDQSAHRDIGNVICHSGVALRVSSGNLIVLSQNSAFINSQCGTLERPQRRVDCLDIHRDSRITSGQNVIRSLRRRLRGNAEARAWPVSGQPNSHHTFALSGLAAGSAASSTRRDYSALSPPRWSQLTFTVLAGIVVGGTSIAGGEGSVPRTTIGVLFIALIGNGINLFEHQ